MSYCIFFIVIVTKQKEFDELLHCIGNNPVFLIGCSECATLCHTGGKDEVMAIKKALEQKNIPVSGWVILEPACHLNNDKRMLKEYGAQLGKSDKILVLACGNGVQTVAELCNDKEIIAGADTLFLGEIFRANEFDKRCTLCGECLLDIFGGFCPVSRCPKSMLNGPCGGASNGKCEIHSELECVWDRIYQDLKKRGKLQVLMAIQKPKDWSKALEMKRRV
jgi:ferredoxin